MHCTGSVILRMPRMLFQNACLRHGKDCRVSENPRHSVPGCSGYCAPLLCQPVLYEDKIRRMGNAGRNGGEYYTPRPLIRTIVKVVNPRIGETVYDPACGSAGFLCEAFNYMQEQVHSVSDSDTLQKSTFFGKEKKGLPYIIATMNMIFHGVAAPNIVRGNTLTENLAAIQQRDRKDIILANPPFGGSERAEGA